MWTRASEEIVEDGASWSPRIDVGAAGDSHGRPAVVEGQTAWNCSGAVGSVGVSRAISRSTTKPESCGRPRVAFGP